MNRTLVVHPYDPTTRFLELAYRGLDAMVLDDKYFTLRTVRILMEKCDQVIMLGHGSPTGLFAVGPYSLSSYLIDATLADQLRERDNNIFIWCHAAQFTWRHRLPGFATGMFISEPGEANLFGVKATETEIQESNYLFANIVGRFATQPSEVLSAAVDHEYGRLATLNPVAAYNHARMRVASKNNEFVTPATLWPAPHRTTERHPARQ